MDISWLFFAFLPLESNLKNDKIFIFNRDNSLKGTKKKITNLSHFLKTHKGIIFLHNFDKFITLTTI